MIGAILAWIVIGLIAGALGKLIMPGDDPGGIIVTILIGIVGAFVGGFVMNLLGFGDVSGIQYLVHPGRHPGSGHTAGYL